MARGKAGKDRERGARRGHATEASAPRAAPSLLPHERYATAAMREVFAPRRRYGIWRRLWLALAEAERDLGLPIREEQLEALRRTAGTIDFEAVRRHEARLRHDVMAHVHAWGDQAPEARGILHLGATSAYVTDNADLILIRDALDIVRRRLAGCLDALGRFAGQWADLPAVGSTHLQVAQLTTVGKRACLWIQDLLLDLERIEFERGRLRLRGVKGTTGTQASFLSLFGGDGAKVRELDARVARAMGFEDTYPVTGQTYPRKVDADVLGALAGLAVSACKMTNDVRILQSRHEIEEPFEKEQIGSSAMAYKRNPMRCERIASLGRALLAASWNPLLVASTQFLERTLDDSANRRLAIPEAFLLADGMLNLVQDVAGGLEVHPRVIRRHVEDALPFLATEELLMEASRAGGDRQALHETIRRASIEARRRMQDEGRPNEMFAILEEDETLGPVVRRARESLTPQRLAGLAPEQTRAFLDGVLAPVLEARRALRGLDARVEV